MELRIAATQTLASMKPDEWHWEHVSSKSLVNPVGADARAEEVSHLPDSYEHIEWMLKGIIDGYVIGEKAHRWIGWAQAVIHIHQEDMPLETFKGFNR